MSDLTSRNIRLLAGVVMLVTASGTTVARVPYPVDGTYADTVRVAVLCNTFAVGECFDMPPVGPECQNSVVAALDTTHVKHVKITPSPTATIDTLLAMFPGALPHVVVHINAGWAGFSGLNLPTVLSWAAEHNIGIVEIGDDDAPLLAPLLGWATSAPKWAPMNTGKWLADPQDSLCIRLPSGVDVKQDSATYPHLTGLVRNVAKILGGRTLYFKSYTGFADGRCEADPDAYAFSAGTESRVTKLGYQQGFNSMCDSISTPGDGTCDTIVGAPWDYTCITAFEDTIPIGGIPGRRRAVSLSFQPQFLQDTLAAQQIVYDAVMYASLVHIGNPTGIRSPGRERSVIGPRDDSRIRVTDATGRTIWQGGVDASHRLRHDVAHWKPGVYVVTSSTLGAGKAHSFVISR